MADAIYTSDYYLLFQRGVDGIGGRAVMGKFVLDDYDKAMVEAVRGSAKLAAMNLTGTYHVSILKEGEEPVGGNRHAWFHLLTIKVEGRIKAFGGVQEGNPLIGKPAIARRRNTL